MVEMMVEGPKAREALGKVVDEIGEIVQMEM
jgi:glycine cleavage system aminomethyltransferase T